METNQYQVYQTIHNNQVIYHEKENDTYILDKEILDQMNKILGIKKNQEQIEPDDLLINKAQVIFIDSNIKLVAMLKRID